MPTPAPDRPNVLTIAGSDSGGGAGIQADLRTVAMLGAHGLSVVTAITAQNTRKVTRVEPLAPSLVRAQIDAVLEDFAIGAIKIGMIATPAIARTVAGALREAADVPVVLDPVLVATTGAKLGRDTLASALRRHLFPLATLVTPNLPEAAAFAGREPRTRANMSAAADALLDLGANAVLLKGGHLRTGREIVDLYRTSSKTHWSTHARIDAEGHGTGCTLSAAIAVELAFGRPLEDAVRRAGDFVHRALASGYRPGRGRVVVLDHEAGARRRR